MAKGRGCCYWCCCLLQAVQSFGGRHSGDLDDPLGLQVPGHRPAGAGDTHDQRPAPGHGAKEPAGRRRVMAMVRVDEAEDLSLLGPGHDLDHQGPNDQSVRRPRIDLPASPKKLPRVHSLDLAPCETGSDRGPVLAGELTPPGFAAQLQDEVLGAVRGRQHVEHSIKDRIGAAVRAGFKTILPLHLLRPHAFPRIDHLHPSSQAAMNERDQDRRPSGLRLSP